MHSYVTKDKKTATTSGVIFACFTCIAVLYQHDGVSTAGQVGLNFRQNVVEQVVVVDLGVQAARRVAPLRRSDE